MHPTALISGKQFFDLYCENLAGAVVVDVGSQNVNGSLKDVVPSSLKYVGVDFAAGKGVDIVLDDPYKLPFSDESVDVVVCSSCFEHCEMFWLLFLEILRILKPRGLFYLNIPSNGMVHRYPVDCWRFYPDSGRALVSWARRNGLAPVLLESFTSKQYQGVWNDFVAVFLKDARYLDRYPKRMIDARLDYYNGYAIENSSLRFPEVLSEDEILLKKVRSAFRTLALEHQKVLRERDAGAAESRDVPSRIETVLHRPSKAGTGDSIKKMSDKKEGVVSIIILTYNQLSYTKECVESIRRHTPEPHEIVFIDNGSSDGTVKWLRQEVKNRPDWRLIENDGNLGFPKGCNQGIEASSGEYILLLNNDVVVTENWLSGMLEVLNSAPDTGIVGPLTNNISGPQKVPVAGYRSTARGLDEYAAAFRRQNRNRRIPMRRIVGFCMLFRRALIDKVGVLDERFGSGNYEDDDFCLRAALLGYTNLVAGDVFLHHYGSRSFVGNRLNVGSSMTGNRKLFTSKWKGIHPDTALGKRLLTLQALEEARVLHARGRTRDAVEALHRGITKNPDTRELHLALAEILMDAKLFKEAFDFLSQTQLDKADLKGLVLTGYCKEGLDCPDEADAVADRVLENDPASARAMNLKGIAAHRRGDRDQAEEWYRKATAADPGYGDPYTNLGTLEWTAGRRTEALPLIQRGFVLSPQSAKLATAYHSAITAIGAWDRAERAFAEARALHPENRRLTHLLTDILLRQHNAIAAMEIINEAMLNFGIDDGLLAAALEVRKKVGPLDTVPQGKRGGISVCLIVKNEEQNLPRCLMGLRSLAREMIVVDTGSTDRSREVATAFGAKVFEQPWTGDFSAARNHSLRQATADWILVMDADETIAPRDVDVLRKITMKRGSKAAAWTFVTRNYVVPMNVGGWTANDGVYAREEAGTGWFPSRKVRLFPNDRRIRFENPVHELVERSLELLKLPVKESPVPIHHYGKLDRGGNAIKGEAYYELGKKKMEEQGENATTLRERAVQAQGLKKYDEALDLWQRAIRLKPDRVHSHLGLASVFLDMGRFNEALAASKKAMEIDPSVREAVYNHALCELYAGDARRAASVLDNLVRRSPDYPLARHLLAMASFCAGDKEGGMRLTRSLWNKRNEGLSESFVRLIRNLTAAGRHEYASALLEAARESGNVNDEIAQLLEQGRPCAPGNSSL